MASIFTTNIQTATVNASASTGADRELRKDVSANVEIANSGNATAVDRQVDIHASDKAIFDKYGVTS